MKNKKASISTGMLTKKFYCHKCGGSLNKYARTRIIKPGDPDYREHSRIGRTRFVGDIELTEYDFKCSSCENIIGYDDQCVISEIQKQFHKNTLSEEEFVENEGRIKEARDKQAKVLKIVFYAIAAIIVALLICFKLASGDFSFKFYL